MKQQKSCSPKQAEIGQKKKKRLYFQVFYQYSINNDVSNHSSYYLLNVLYVLGIILFSIVNYPMKYVNRRTKRQELSQDLIILLAMDWNKDTNSCLLYFKTHSFKQCYMQPDYLPPSSLLEAFLDNSNVIFTSARWEPQGKVHKKIIQRKSFLLPQLVYLCLCDEVNDFELERFS